MGEGGGGEEDDDRDDDEEKMKNEKKIQNQNLGNDGGNVIDTDGKRE